MVSSLSMNESEENIDKSVFLKALGQHIKSLREKKGLSAAEFGRRAFMERSHVARLESGGTNPTATTMKVICEALEIELEDLFKGFKF
jgi:HTH-type transcriptional regulator / antitoxin HipB